MVTMSELLREAAKKGAQRRPSGKREHYIQCACVRLFRYKYPDLQPLLFAIPNGGRRDKVTAAQLSAEGVVAGVSDLILLVKRGPYGGLCIEMKTDKGRQSPAQRAWQQAVEAAGFAYIICRNVDEFDTKVTQFLNQK